MCSASYLQLLETKSTDRKQTLLHFIVGIIQEKFPEVQSFYSELHFLEKAAMGEHFLVCHMTLLVFPDSPMMGATYYRTRTGSFRVD